MNNEELRSDLEAAKSIIEDERRWSKGAYSRNKPIPTEDGMVVVETACAMGAIGYVTLGNAQNVQYVNKIYPGTEGDRRAVRARAALDYELTSVDLALGGKRWVSVETFNDADETTHGDVMDLFDRAIKTSVSEVVENGSDE